MCAWSVLCPSSYRSECLKKCWKKFQHSQQPNYTWISLTVLGRGRLSSRHLKGEIDLNEMWGTRRLLWKLFAVFFWPKGFRNLNQGKLLVIYDATRRLVNWLGSTTQLRRPIGSYSAKINDHIISLLQKRN